MVTLLLEAVQSLLGFKVHCQNCAMHSGYKIGAVASVSGRSPCPFGWNIIFLMVPALYGNCKVLCSAYVQFRSPAY